MKKITLFIAFAFLFIIKSNAQVSSYSFAQSDGSYSEFTDGTVLGTATGNATGAPSLDSEVYMVTLPFSFIFNGASYSSCNVSSNGYITFGATAPTTGLSTPISSTVAYNGSISAWGGDLNALFELGGLTGDIQWKEIGTAPNREFVVQYRNFRPSYTTSTTLAPYINFQIRLSETTNLIKLVYGSTGLAVGTTNSSTTKQIGLRGATNTDFKNRTNATTVLFVSSTAGTLNTNTQAYSSVNATPGVPSNGLTYTWTPPTCSAPLSTAVSNITTTTATISWLATATVPSGGYEYYYSTSNVAPTGAGTATSNLTENLTGLSDSSNYFLWMRSNCGSGDYSGWVGPISFVTLCTSVTSFSQNFDAVTTPNLPLCWGKIISNGASTYASVTTTTTNSSTPNGVSLYNSDSPSTSNIILVSPILSNLSAGTHRIRFTGRNSSATQDIEIGTLSDPNDASTFTVLQTIDLSSTFSDYVVSFATYSGSNTYIGFRRLSTSTYTYVYLDNIYWEVIPTGAPNCSVVSTPVNGSINQNVATNLGWSTNTDATGYKLSIGTTSGGTDILNNVDLGNVTSYNPPIDFAYNTLYYVNLIAYNSTGDSTGCIQTSFTTSVPPPAGSICSNSIVISALPYTTTDNTANYGDDYENGSSPCSLYYMSGDDVVYTYTPTANIVVDVLLSNLGGTYSGIHILDGCPGTSPNCVAFMGNSATTNRDLQNVSLVGGITYYIVISTWATPQSTTYTLNIVDNSLATNNFDNANFSYYPNPVKNTLNLSYTQNISDVAVYNLLGQQVMAKAINANQSQIDMSHLSSGAYMVKVTADNQVKTIKVIKE